ncbi:MAG: ribose-phosphate diphosphokinase [Nanoarchaeota archaeon]
MLVTSFADAAPLAKKVAKILGAPFALLQEHDFPDGEALVKVPKPQQQVVVVSQLHYPNAKILPLIFALSTLRDLGARRITLVVPYMPYLRQDARFHSGEAVSNHIFTSLFSAYAGRIITIDPHLHRVSNIESLFPQGKRLTAVKLLAAFLRAHYPKAIIVGPDEESFQWAMAVAGLAKTRAMVLKKKRFDDEHVHITEARESLRGQTVAIVDDIISSGHTMLEVIRQAKRQKAKRIVCLAVHGIFAENADEKLRRLGAVVVTTNTIPHQSNRIDVAPLIAEALHGRD